jgi:hypothetical protein
MVLGIGAQTMLQAGHGTLELRAVEAGGHRLPAREAQQVVRVPRPPGVHGPLPACEGGVDGDAEGAVGGGRDSRGCEGTGCP